MMSSQICDLWLLEEARELLGDAQIEIVDPAGAVERCEPPRHRPNLPGPNRCNASQKNASSIAVAPPVKITSPRPAGMYSRSLVRLSPLASFVRYSCTDGRCGLRRPCELGLVVSEEVVAPGRRAGNAILDLEVARSRPTSSLGWKIARLLPVGGRVELSQRADFGRVGLGVAQRPAPVAVALRLVQAERNCWRSPLSVGRTSMTSPKRGRGWRRASCRCRCVGFAPVKLAAVLLRTPVGAPISRRCNAGPSSTWSARSSAETTTPHHGSS